MVQLFIAARGMYTRTCFMFKIARGVCKYLCSSLQLSREITVQLFIVARGIYIIL